jgi:hypothetical protein
MSDKAVTQMTDPEYTVEFDGKETYVMCNGVKLAMRRDYRWVSIDTVERRYTSGREYGFPNDPHHYAWTPSQSLPSPPFVTDDLPQFAHLAPPFVSVGTPWFDSIIATRSSRALISSGVKSLSFFVRKRSSTCSA